MFLLRAVTATFLVAARIPSLMLKGKRIGLRPLETTDTWLMYRWFNDHRVLEDLGAEHMYFATSMEEEAEFVVSMTRDTGSVWFIIEMLEGHEPIGVVGLANIDQRNAAAELRIVVGEPSRWGQGLGRETIGLVLDYGFDTRNLHRIWLRVASYNQRAISCYRASGFVDEGAYRQDHFHKGRWQDARRMSILVDEHRRKKDASG